MVSTPFVRSMIQHIGDLLALWPRSNKRQQVIASPAEANDILREVKGSADLLALRSPPTNRYD